MRLKQACSFTLIVALFSAGLSAGNARLAKAQAVNFNQIYTASTCDGVPATDPVGDQSPSDSDVVGDVAHPSQFFAHDENYLYLRIRVASDPTASGSGNFAQRSWNWGFETDGNTSEADFDLVAILDGKNPESVSLQDPNNPIPLWSDPSTSTYARALGAGSSVGGGTDYFIDIAVPLQSLTDVGAFGGIVLYIGTSTSASGVNKDWNCWDNEGGAPPTPGDVPADPIDIPHVCDTNSDCSNDPENPFCIAGFCEPCSSDPQCMNAFPSTPICDFSGACVVCSDSSDCSGATPICNGSHVCVACSENAQCISKSMGTPYCISGACSMDCTSDLQCTNTPGLALCETVSGDCVSCLTNANCSGETPICNTGTHVCEACDENTECSEPTPVCDGGSGACVDCVVNGNCSGMTPFCNTSTNTCEGCDENSDCTNPALPVCETGSGVCVECLANPDCSLSEPVCDTDPNTCGPCTVDGDCSNVNAPACDTGSGTCVECTDDGDCGVGGTCNLGTHTCDRDCDEDSDCINPLFPACDTNSGLCVQCTSTNDSQCVDTMPVCDTDSFTCEACSDSSDCTDVDAPACDTGSGACVECVMNSDCSLAEPICDTGSFTCGGCNNNTDCENNPALPVCQISSGECVICSDDHADACSTTRDGSACISDPDPRCGCNTDNDCASGDYCDTNLSLCADNNFGLSGGSIGCSVSIISTQDSSNTMFNLGLSLLGIALVLRRRRPLVRAH